MYQLLHTLYRLAGRRANLVPRGLREVLTFDWTMPNGGSSSSFACLHVHPTLHPPDVN